METTNRCAWYAFDTEEPGDGYVIVFTPSETREQAIAAARDEMGITDTLIADAELDPATCVVVHRVPRLDRYAHDGRVPSGELPEWVSAEDGSEHSEAPPWESYPRAAS